MGIRNNLGNLYQIKNTKRYIQFLNCELNKDKGEYLENISMSDYDSYYYSDLSEN